MITIDDDLLNSKEKYIAHICNCISYNSAGVAKAIFDRFSYSDTYSSRKINNFKDKVGSISIHGNGKDQRYIINMYAQYYPGKSKYINSKLDSIKLRLEYFHQCLISISEIENLESIAFPYFVGCGLAGGDWKMYSNLLDRFAKYIKEKHNANTFLYRKK